MGKLIKIFRIYSLAFIVVGVIAFIISVISGILNLLNIELAYDTVSSAKLFFLDGRIFILIGGLLQAIAGYYGYQTYYDEECLFRAILFSILALTWQTAGFIVLLTNHIINIRLLLQIPMTFAFLVMALFLKYQTTNWIKKKHISANPLENILDGHSKHKNIAHFFQGFASQKRHTKRMRMPILNIRVKRINIRPKRKFKR